MCITIVDTMGVRDVICSRICGVAGHECLVAGVRVNFVVSGIHVERMRAVDITVSTLLKSYLQRCQSLSL